MKIALAQINPTVGDFSGNLAKITEFVERANQSGAELVVFPELAVCGYPPADLLEKDAFLKKAEETLAEIAKLTNGLGRPAVLVGCALPSGATIGKQAKNVAVLLDDGKVVFEQQKMLLPFYDVFDEQRYFEPGTEQALFLLRGTPMAITICEDAWNDKAFWQERNYTIDPVEELMKQWPALPQLKTNDPLILNISASPYWHGKTRTRREMLGALAKRHKATVILVNQVGANDSLIFDGDSIVVRPDGTVCAQAKAFEEDLVIFDTEAPTCAPLERNEEKNSASWDALVLGTRDYVRKCGFKRALVGLSGGIDSALVAVIAVAALGKENVQGIGMPSGFSSTGSVSDAEALAKNLGIEFSVAPIREVYESFMEVLKPAFADTKFGLAEENLQPRVRGTILMAISNKTGALVLTTGNKSEMACGYCTLYGDMVGALAVIADLYKTEVYALSEWVNRDGEVIPKDTLTKPPSAELRPGQKDTDSLPPYDVLDPILREYIEEYRGAEEIAAEQKVDVELVRDVIKLVERSEYKRQQAAPVLKVSKKSFGMGRRFPIAAKREV